MPQDISSTPQGFELKKRKRNCSCASFHFGKGRQALVVSVNPLASESTFVYGYAQCSSWSAIVIFEHSVSVPCCNHEQINMAYLTNIIQHDGSFCDENYRSWMDIEWNQLKIREFFLTAPRLQAVCRSTPTVGPCVCFGRWFRKLVEPGKVYCIVYGTELCYADRGAVVFTRHVNSEVRQQKLRAESSDSTLRSVEWCQLIRVIICWTHLSHWRLFTGQLMAVLILQPGGLQLHICQSYKSQVLFWNYVVQC